MKIIIKSLKIFLLIVSLVCFSLPPLSSCITWADVYQAQVENISNKNYFEATLNAIENARESIVIAMYIIALDPEGEDTDVKKLLDALVSAKKRGVKVKVILEYHSSLDFTPKGLRYYTYHYLKDNGIEVHFDKSPNRCLHAKTVVIDRELVITGSSNWSEAAFKSSYETNLLVRCRPLALEILKDLEEIPLRKEPVKTIKDTFPIPLFFCSSRTGALKRIVAATDERSLDVLLILWNENKDIVSCDFIAQMLGLTKRMDRTGYRQQIKKTLRKLQEKYKLIKYKCRHGKDEIGMELLSYPGEGPIRFPKDYFRYNWNTRLTLSGKTVLITMYAELGEVTDNITSLPILYLSKKYGMKVHTYSKGIQELRRFNIIKVQYGKGYKQRPDTKITILGLYDMENYNNKIQELKLQYGEELVTEVQGLAGIIYSAYDIDITKDILRQIDFYGIDNVREAFNYVKRMRPDNYKRAYRYILGILKKHKKKE